MNVAEDRVPTPGEAAGRNWTWETRPIDLRYSLGERVIGRVRFRLAVASAHFTELPVDACVRWSGWDGVAADVDGVLIRSQPVSAPLPRRTRLPDAIRYVPAQYRRHYMELGKTFEEFLRKFSSQTRANRRREVRKFAESAGGQLDFREYRTPDEVTEFIRLARELSTRTYQERLLGAGFPSSPEYARYLLDRAGRGRLRAFLLFHSGRPAAYLMHDVLESGVVLSLFTGFDPEFRALSPGAVVHYLAFERLFAEPGLRMVDFTEGEGMHKQLYATGSVQCADIYFMRPTLRNGFLLALHAALDSVTLGTGALLERLGLKARVKKLLRSWA